MKKLTLLATAFLAFLIALPLMAAAFVVSSAPAVAQAVQCTSASLPATGEWRPPFQQAYTVSARGFGSQFHPIYQEWRAHTGQDMSSLPGPGPVVAASQGTVVSAGVAGGYGNLVVVDHGSSVSTYYAHLASIAPNVTAGATVWTGQQLGVEGTTGTSTGNHLHFEVRQNGTPIDPVPFMLERGAPLNGKAVAPSSPPGTGPSDPGGQQGGIGFALPSPGTPRLNSLNNPPLPIPADIKTLYVAAAEKYHLPWTLLAGIGMEETAHGRNNTTSSAGAQGLMQFMPATWATYGVDGDGDGRADIHNNADSAMSAANYLTASGVTAGPVGVRRAIFAYNHADWYVNDVLYYAAAYGGGLVPGDPSDCGPGGVGNPNLHRSTTPRSPACSPGPKATSVTPTSSAPTGRTPGTAPASPKPPTPTSESPSRAPPQHNGTGSPPATASESRPGRNNPATCSSSTATSDPTRSGTS